MADSSDLRFKHLRPPTLTKPADELAADQQSVDLEPLTAEQPRAVSADGRFCRAWERRAFWPALPPLVQAAPAIEPAQQMPPMAEPASSPCA